MCMITACVGLEHVLV